VFLFKKGAMCCRHGGTSSGKTGRPPEKKHYATGLWSSQNRQKKLLRSKQVCKLCNGGHLVEGIEGTPFDEKKGKAGGEVFSAKKEKGKADVNLSIQGEDAASTKNG